MRISSIEKPYKDFTSLKGLKIINCDKTVICIIVVLCLKICFLNITHLSLVLVHYALGIV